MVTPPEALARATSNMGNRFLEPSVLTQHHQQCNSPLATFCSLTTSLLCGWASQWSCTSEVVEDVPRLKKVKTLRQSLHPLLFNFSSRKHPSVSLQGTPLEPKNLPDVLRELLKPPRDFALFAPLLPHGSGWEWVSCVSQSISCCRLSAHYQWEIGRRSVNSTTQSWPNLGARMWKMWSLVSRPRK